MSPTLSGQFFFFSLLVVLCSMGSVLSIFTGNKETWLKFLSICFIFVWLSSSFPSVSYDMLMSIFWKVFLPFMLLVLIISVYFVCACYSGLGVSLFL